MKVIAEVGSNWKTHDDCLHSVEQAARAGADIVKFQYYTNECLYGVPGPRNCLPLVSQLASHAKEHDIEFMCTAFSRKGYQIVDPLVKRHKIASSEITDLDILETVNSFRKPVILSTGGATHQEIAYALLVLRNVPVTLLYCVVDYPARIVDFRHLRDLREKHGGSCAYGYSDHSVDVLNIPSLARKHGAVILEKHVNFTEHTDTSDHPHSLSGHEFRMMIKHLKRDLLVQETARPNPYKRTAQTIQPFNSRGYYRPPA